MTIHFESAVPQFTVVDVVRTAECYRDVLGFEIAGYWAEPLKRRFWVNLRNWFRGSKPEVWEACTRCGLLFKVNSMLDPWGFREFTCPNCHLRVVVPLKWTYRITYWVFLGFWAFALILILCDLEEYSKSRLGGAVGLLGALFLLRVLVLAIFHDLKILYYRWRLEDKH